ncbi:MAG: twin transmembrane helix small protein [Gammaproteobacteria bacterium]|jgi:cytochrome bd-type quinol oxidase subunit 2|nr:twin transmembrane helix small protein [Gammaproteobacteria bacterium]
MIYKSLIVVVLLAIVASLASGLFFMLNDKGQSKRMVNSLTVRISLSVALFVLLFVGWYFGLIQPHPVAPQSSP